METPDEKKGRIKFNGNWPLTYDEADEDATFSDHEGKYILSASSLLSKYIPCLY